MMLDGNGAVYPIARDCVGCVREPPALDLQPARALAAHALPLQPHAPHAHHHNALKSQVTHSLTHTLIELERVVFLNIHG